MGQHVVLNNVEHHDLRLITRRGAAFGDSANQTVVYPSEYQEIQRHYPIFFRQAEGGGLQSVALLGFDKAENLFLDGDVWNAGYIPAMHRVGPFLIGQPQAAPGEALPEDADAVILVDPAHARISRTEGEALFLSNGGNSPALNEVGQVLEQVYYGARASDAMFAAFQDSGLLAPVQIEVKIDDTQSFILKDMLTISREALHNLDDAHLRALNQAGFLALAFHVVSSMGNLSRMITLKTSRAAVAA
ncbi:SapC family protein [Asticcacaulis solisilvae]|uniref:SapC family protein n=1 Tax=Asticcacaulis solisilvae TaxID=1217274 RepID=UPI003FD8A911